MHKHNIRDVYDDELRKDRLFITADVYLKQANHTKKNGQIQQGLTKPLSNQTLYWLQSPDNDEYEGHYRKTFIEEKKNGQSTVNYLGSYFKTLQHPLQGEQVPME